MDASDRGAQITPEHPALTRRRDVAFAARKKKNFLVVVVPSFYDETHRNDKQKNGACQKGLNIF